VPDLSDLDPGPQARAFVTEAHRCWEADGGDARSLALAMLMHASAMLMILDGHAEHIALYRRAAEAIDATNNTAGSA
jgi:hypothetical protein